jgi:hypothetical protein
MEIAGIVVLSIFGFYAVRLLATFKQGMLEKGWRNVTSGALMLAIAQIPFLVSRIGNAALGSLLNETGNILRFIGIVFLILGFRAQYQVWRVDNKDLSSAIQPTNPS